uniref:Scavenger receptor class F member 1-like n=1 Tax=Crassostrea virginica TaxID=6565 RepID=A0A8B8A6C0_CRAVI|nr:scavenger receptor class F member 1-like [Crassostrea virginica]
MLFLKIVFLVWVIQYRENIVAASVCESVDNDGCCDGYYLEKANCTKCMPGYIGPKCTIPCLYPSYGELCQGNCSCSKSSCDISTGCKALITDNKTSFPVTIEHTASRRSVTLYTTAAPSSISGTINGVLIILILIFGGVDIFLICIHLVLFVIDHQRENTPQRQNTTGRQFVTRNNSMYENIEIGLSNY